MKTDDSKFQSAQDELKQLIDDVARAMGKAQAAIARVTTKAAEDEAPVTTQDTSIAA